MQPIGDPGPTRDVGPSAAGGMSVAATGEVADDAHVAISIVHGSLADAEYPLMFGGFTGEHFGGVERFLDRQFGGLLSSWSEIDVYPHARGTSRFVPPSDTDDETEPPGGYVIGLGALADLDRAVLTLGVRHALVDRCMRLYRAPSEGDGRVGVGVSSLLIGVHDESGLRVEDAVAGIVDGVLEANRALARYESTRHDDPARTATSVRVVALEFVERLAERANLACVALRGLPGVLQLDDGYDELRAVSVEQRPGGLPLGASLSETVAPWRRFLITAGDTADAAEADPRLLELEVSVLGRDARVDHVRHRLDRAMVDALVERLASSTDDVTTATTLYDQLVPHELRTAFQTTSGVQFVVDAVASSYPWELLAAPRPSSGPRSGFAGVLRQFTESQERRSVTERASVGGALVVAAGNVVGQPQLPGVHDEADAVAGLLHEVLAGPVTLLSDRDGELDLVDVQNQLFADHQVLHIASHGTFDETRAHATGAILSSMGMLTVDTVRQLRWVPEVVFLNCCNLGRIGTNRFTAGLAREFMAIGVRALVAAAWSIDDRAALAFAETFYRELIAGRPLGDAVTLARNRCAEVGGRQTWAAYQCYGDPGFVLRGANPHVGAAVTDPVSSSDLVARLESLAVKTSDLGRPGRGGADVRLARLTATWRELAAWIDARPSLRDDADVQRRLATIARQLGMFRAAADRFRVFVVAESADGPVVGATQRATSVADLQQAANCLTRAAQQEARQADPRGEGPLPAALRADLDLAIELATSAVGFLPDRESLGILASAHKRAATVDRARRSEHLVAALDAYRRADAHHADQRFGAENALQLALVLGGEHAAWARGVLAERSVTPVATAETSTPSAPRLVDRRRGDPVGYWARADRGDRALTRLVAAGDEDERVHARAELVAAYERAFASRSTWAERQSVLDHLRDLSSLVPADDPVVAHLEWSCDGLRRWELRHVEHDAAAGGGP